MNFPKMTEQQIRFFLYDCAIMVADKLDINTHDYNDSSSLLKAIQEKADLDSQEIAEALNNYRTAYLKWFEMVSNEKQDVNTSEAIELITKRDKTRQLLVDLYSKS